MSSDMRTILKRAGYRLNLRREQTKRCREQQEGAEQEERYQPLLVEAEDAARFLMLEHYQN